VQEPYTSSPAHEVGARAVSERAGDDRLGQLAFGRELKVQRQGHLQRPDRVADLLARDPLAGADQRVPGTLADIGTGGRC